METSVWVCVTCFVSDLFQAHRLIGVGPRLTQGSHHLKSAIRKFTEIEAWCVLRKLNADKKHQK